MDSVWLWYPKNVRRNANSSSPFTTPIYLFLMPTFKIPSHIPRISTIAAAESYSVPTNVGRKNKSKNNEKVGVY